MYVSYFKRRYFTVKRFVSIIVVAMLAVSMLAMTSCGKSEFSGSVDDDKNMTINAVKAADGDYFVTGSLVVDEGEEVAINSNLESGAITVEFISSEGEQSDEELPDINGEATYTAFLEGTNSQAVSFGTGTFMIKPTVTEKATGTITITVRPAE